jgi:hypothetical protein
MRRFVVIGLVALGLGAALAACFSPLQPACAFSCSTTGACPSAYVCASDGLCHRADGKGLCLLDPVDGAASNGADGAASDGAAGAGP